MKWFNWSGTRQPKQLPFANFDDYDPDVVLLSAEYTDTID